MVKRFRTLVVSMVLGLSLIVSLSGCSSETYTPTEKSPTIASPVIGRDGVLRVGVDAGNPPYAAQPSDKIVGLNVDIAAAIADELGLKVEIVDIGADPDKALQDGTVDIVMGVDKSDSAITCWRSEAYIQSGVALFSMSSSAKAPTAGTSTKIAAQSSSMSAWEVNKQYGEESLVSAADLKGAFADLSAGTVNYVAADAVIGTYAAYTSDPRVDASIVALMQKPTGYAIGVLDTNAELKQIISDTLVALTGNGMVNLIETKWLGKPLDLSSVPLTEGAAVQNNTTNTNQGGTTIDTNGGDQAEGSTDEGSGDTEQNDDEAA